MNRLIKNLTFVVAALVFAIAAGAFVLSYDALYKTGAAHGIPAGKAWLWPLLIDAPLVVFTLALLVAQLTRQSIKLWAGLVGVYTLATVVFNLSHAQQGALGWLVAVVAPLGLLLTTEALRHLAKTVIERQAAVETLAELNAAVAGARAELDALTRQLDAKEQQIGALASEIDALKADKAALVFGENTPKSNNQVDNLNAARVDAKRERVNTLLDYLNNNPYASLTEAAPVVGVSRQTIGVYVSQLTQAGRLHRNGNGWEVLS